MQNVITLYGIPNCNTVKKACDWLEKHEITYTFYDFKKQAVSQQLLENWLTQFPYETLINRASLTWRGLDDATKASIINNASAIELMQAKTSLIKRPILLKNGKILSLGFNETTYKELLT